MQKGCSKENIYSVDEIRIFYNITFKGERCDAPEEI
jgi:hypothetical protein